MKYKNQKFTAKPKGFTLLEFIVASSLALIVITAAGGTYFMTRKLGDSTQKRLDIQQNLRNAASTLTRDARNAGTFGCFNTALKDSFPSLPTTLPTSITLNKDKEDGYGVRLIPATDLPSTSGVSLSGNALVLIYGRGSAGVTGKAADNTTVTLGQVDNEPDLYQSLQGHGPLVLSGCYGAVAGTANSDTVMALTASGTAEFSSNGLAGNFDSTTNKPTTGDLVVSRLYAAAYVLGSVGGANSALLRYDLDGSGQWQGPQLMAEGISKMDVSFAYVNHCVSDDGNSYPDKYDFSATLDQKKLPAMVRLHLTYNTSVDKTSTSTADYIINAAIRGGKECSTDDTSASSPGA